MVCLRVQSSVIRMCTTLNLLKGETVPITNQRQTLVTARGSRSSQSIHSKDEIIATVGGGIVALFPGSAQLPLLAVRKSRESLVSFLM